MFLICGHIADPLVSQLLHSAVTEDISVQVVEENYLFENCQIAFERHALASEGYVQLRGQRIHFQEMRALVLRLPRAWWPSTEFDFQDQMFVYHETIASWFALTDTLKCPVINRFGLGWWLNDLCYPLELREDLARDLELCWTPRYECEPSSGRFCPTGRPSSIGTQSVYRSGGSTFPTPTASSDLLTYLAHWQERLLQWERRTGIALSRIDFQFKTDLGLEWVETYPVLNDESDKLVCSIADSIVRQIDAKPEVTL